MLSSPLFGRNPQLVAGIAARKVPTNLALPGYRQRGVGYSAKEMTVVFGRGIEIRGAVPRIKSARESPSSTRKVRAPLPWSPIRLRPLSSRSKLPPASAIGGHR